MTEKSTVLIVDDNPISMEVLFEQLRRADFKVLTAENGLSALKRVEYAHPDIILLDILLPDISGFEVCRRLKADETVQDIPVIFITALADTVDKVKGFEVGGADYITKPIEIAEVLARLNTHLTIHRLQQNLARQNEQLQEENLRRKRVQELLKESRARYRLLAENSTDMISQQSVDGVYRYVSPACRALLGYEVEEMIGRSVYDFFHPQDLTAVQELNELVEEWPTVSTLTYRARRKDGSYIWLETISKLIRLPESGVPTEVVAVARNITDRRALEETLRKQNQELDAFAHTVAHDLKDPLGVLIGYAQLLQVAFPQMDEKRIQDTLRKINQTGQQMIDIIESLLLLAGVRKGEVTVEPVDMADIIPQVERRLALMIDDFEAEITYPAEWPQALGYRPWIEEVWANYVSNGLKYGDRPPRLELGAVLQPEGMIRFWVRDNGQGLTPEEQRNLFAEFIRLGQVRVEGHGLGLSIVRRIIEKLGGEVGVESEVGQGSLFYFTLPAV